MTELLPAPRQNLDQIAEGQAVIAAAEAIAQDAARTNEARAAEARANENHAFAIVDRRHDPSVSFLGSSTAAEKPIEASEPQSKHVASDESYVGPQANNASELNSKYANEYGLDNLAASLNPVEVAAKNEARAKKLAGVQQRGELMQRTDKERFENNKNNPNVSVEALKQQWANEDAATTSGRHRPENVIASVTDNSAEAPVAITDTTAIEPAVRTGGRRRAEDNSDGSTSLAAIQAKLAAEQAGIATGDTASATNPTEVINPFNEDGTPAKLSLKDAEKLTDAQRADLRAKAQEIGGAVPNPDQAKEKQPNRKTSVAKRLSGLLRRNRAIEGPASTPTVETTSEEPSDDLMDILGTHNADGTEIDSDKVISDEDKARMAAEDQKQPDQAVIQAQTQPQQKSRLFGRNKDKTVDPVVAAEERIKRELRMNPTLRYDTRGRRLSQRAYEDRLSMMVGDEMESHKPSAAKLV